MYMATGLFKRIPSEDYFAVTGALQLTALMPRTIIRGSDLHNDIIWIQSDNSQMRDRTMQFYHLPSLYREGVFLCFIKPVSRLVQRLSRDNPLARAIVKADKSTSPHALAEKLGFSKWLNSDTWFELHSSFSAFRVDMPAREIEFPSDMPEFDREQRKMSNARIRKVKYPEAITSTELTLSANQLAEIEKLAVLFNSPDKLPTAQDLIAMKSDFANAILRELANTASENLDGGLRKVKESIPTEVLEKIANQE
jgi:hypothetical protein